jgi:ABC-type multidrug transport system ATPase subunit
VITFEDCRFREGKLRIGPLSFTCKPGLTALIGHGRETHTVLAAVARGHAHSGTLQLRGASIIRTDVVFVGLTPELPANFSGRECIEYASRYRGLRTFRGDASLERFGLGSLANIRVSEMTTESKRAVAIVEALTSNAPIVALVEPFAQIPMAAVPGIERALRELSSGATCVLLAMASPGEARDIGATCIHIHQSTTGAPFTIAAAEADPWSNEVKTRYDVWLDTPEALLRALESEQVEAIVQGPHLRITGQSATELAAAIARAVVNSGSALQALVATVESVHSTDTQGNTSDRNTGND